MDYDKDCIFCKIVTGEIPSNKIYEDEEILCFRDLDPQAPAHVLIIPKTHIASIDEVKESHTEIVGHLIAKVPEIASLLELTNGYRLVCNCGSDGLQTVPHLHFHLLGGRAMSWPPG